LTPARALSASDGPAPRAAVPPGSTSTTRPSPPASGRATPLLSEPSGTPRRSGGGRTSPRTGDGAASPGQGCYMPAQDIGHAATAQASSASYADVPDGSAASQAVRQAEPGPQPPAPAQSKMI
jgi:hypothetical protein